MKAGKAERWRIAVGAVFAALLTSIGLVTAAGAEDRAQTSIVGGTTATTEEWPWTAFILALDSKDMGFGCTGTVVAPTLVLTAGHCIQDIVTGRRTPPSRYIVVTGSSDIRDKTVRQVSKVQRALPYPGFNPFKLHGDAGLLVLAKPTTAPPITLAGPADAALLAPNVPAYIAGWGERGSRGNAKETVVLRKAQTFVQRRLYCRNHTRVYYLFYNSSTQMCTSTPPTFHTGTCHGDSGGPALAFREDGTAVQIGITSLGPANCDATRPDVYTRVDKIAGWVGKWIAATTPSPVPPVEG
jgi:secreted trypsin-like serine protease